MKYSNSIRHHFDRQCLAVIPKRCFVRGRNRVDGARRGVVHLRVLPPGVAPKRTGRVTLSLEGNPAEAVEEKVSLSDRFGLWLGFHKCNQDDYLAMVDGYIKHFKLGVELEEVRGEALEWSTTRGSRSGRVAWQYVMDLAGRLGKNLN